MLLYEVEISKKKYVKLQGLDSIDHTNPLMQLMMMIQLEMLCKMAVHIPVDDAAADDDDDDEIDDSHPAPEYRTPSACSSNMFSIANQTTQK
jgi:hypothetical protein